MSLFSSAVNLAGGSQLKLLGVVIVATVIATSVAGGIFYVKNLQRTVEKQNQEIAQLKVDNGVLKDNNEVLKDNMKKLATANFNNYNTNQALLAERGQATRAISNLAAANLRQHSALDNLSKKIEDMLKDPKNDGPVAPVLRAIIVDIQKERAGLK